ncbi:MAG: DegV family protein [Acetanaerobacterium sp.]
MREYQIFTDSTCDLPAALAEELGVTVLPMEFELEGKPYLHYPDARNYGFHEFYEQLRAGNLSKTSQVSIATYAEYFEPVLKAGRDILCISFSSALSGTYSAAALAAEDLCAKYPDRQVYAVDSRAASAGEGLLVYTAAKMKAGGMEIEPLRDWVANNRDHLCHWFTVDDLNHLKRGGRVTAMSALLGTALGVKPVLHVDDEGRLIPMEKVRGRRKSLEALVEHMAATCTKPDGQYIFIGHGDSIADVEFTASLVRKRFPTVADVIITFIGPVVGSHSGPGTIALFFFGTEK